LIDDLKYKLHDVDIDFGNVLIEAHGVKVNNADRSRGLLYTYIYSKFGTVMEKHNPS